MLSTIPNPTQDYLSDSERLHLEQHSGCVYQVVLKDEAFGGEMLIRVFVEDDSFAAICAAVNVARRELKLDSKWKIFEPIPVKKIEDVF